MLEIYEFQTRASTQLSERSLTFMEYDERSHILFHAPMASGKTTTCALAAQQMLDVAPDTVFVFVSKGDLPKQAHKTFKNIVKNNGKTYFINNVQQMNYFSGGTVFAVNWELLNNSKLNSLGQVELTSKHVTGSENTVGLARMIQNTLNRGTKVVLFIDEVHEFASTPASQAIMSMFQPSVVVGVTATPKPQNREIANYTVKVDYDEVRATGLIKQNVYININLENFAHLEDEIAVLEAAWERICIRKERLEMFGYDINPVLLIQLPSDSKATQDSDRLMIRRVEEFFSKKNVTEANGRLAVWLADRRSPCVDNGDLQRNNGKAQVLIFKTAVATGIDIPRASVLAIFRKSDSVTLSTQVAGRILRQPTMSITGDDILDSSDIITNLPTDMIQFEGDDVEKVFKTVYCNVKSEPAKVKFNLPNVCMFATTKPVLDLKTEGLIIDKVAPVILGNKSGFKFGAVAKHSTISNTEVESDIDSIISGLSSSKNGLDLLQSDFTVRKAFRSYVHSMFSPLTVDTAQVYKLVSRGISILEDVLEPIGVKKDDVARFIMSSAVNQNKLMVMVKDAINELINSGQIKITRKFEDTVFESLPVGQSFHVKGLYQNAPYKKNAFDNLPLTFDSQAEKSFDSFIDNLPEVTSWSINQPSLKESLGIKYSDKNAQTGVESERLMFPDRIIMLTDGTLFIAEVKSGRAAVDAGLKSNALQAYISVTNEKIASGVIDTDIKQVIGGIVDVESNGSQTVYRVFVGVEYTPDRSSEGWVDLASIIPESSVTASKEAKVAELEKQLALLKAES